MTALLKTNMADEQIAGTPPRLIQASHPVTRCGDVRQRRPFGHRLILELTASIIRRVIADLGLELANEPGIHVAINVSARDMEDGGFLDVLGQAIEQARPSTFMHLDRGD